MLLSFCLLTRNAEQQIERALRSLAGLCAEVIVGDTGSTDGTAQRARSLGAKVSLLAWQDDFGTAQNQVLSAATGDWIFWLNPDEELLPQSTGEIAALLARPQCLAYFVRVQAVLQAEQLATATETWQPRLFRRHPDLRFVGRLHPHFAVPLEEVARRENKQVCPSGVLVRQHAYLSVLTPEKLRWATRLLELELQDRPGQLHYLIEYGRNLLRLNDPKGHLVLAEAADLVLACADAAAAPNATVASLLEYLLTVSAQQSRSRLLPPQARALVLRWFPNSPPLLWALAERCFRAEDFQEAAGLLERLLHLGRTRTYDRSAAFDPRIMAELALLNLGRCYRRLGALDRADACFTQLLGSPGVRDEAQRERDIVQRLRQR